MEIKSVQDPRTTGPAAAESGVTPLSALARFSRIAFAGLAAVFLVCVVVQIFLAGLATFVHPLNWARHTAFVHFFEIVPLLMLLFSFTGRLPQRLRWQSAGLFGLIFVQYFTANIRAILPLGAALHPVVAVGIFMASWAVLREAWPLAFGRQSK